MLAFFACHYLLRKIQLLSLWQQRPVGKGTENDLALFYREVEIAFPQLLRRRGGDPYRNLMNDVRGRVNNVTFYEAFKRLK